MKFSAMKNRARISLENQWGKAIGGTVLTIACICVNTLLCYGIQSSRFLGESVSLYRPAAQFALFAVSSVLLFILLQRQEAWRLGTIGQISIPHRQILFSTMLGQYCKVVALHLLVLMRKILWMFLLTPGGLLLYAASRTSEIGALCVVYWIGGGISFLAGVLFWICAIQRYVMCRFLMIMNPKMKLGQIIRESVRLMQGKCWNLVCYRISFLPWWISCVTIVSAVYVVPYHAQCLTFYKYRIYRAAQNKSVPK